MKSIKPGRGPSAMGAIGSVFAVVFGIFWTIMAAQMGAPFFFLLFGVGFVCLGIVQALYHYKNATEKNRYSTFDITDEGEETDPLQRRFGAENDGAPLEDVSPLREGKPGEDEQEGRFCPYCGTRAGGDYVFCRKCGKRLS